MWCHCCGGGSINKKGWGHKKDHGQDVVSLVSVGKLAQAQREFLWIRRGGKAAAAFTCAEKQVIESGRSSEQPANSMMPLVYRFNFGKHKGCLIDDLFNCSDDSKRGYIPYLFARRGKSSKSWYMNGLELALRKEGWWQRVEQECKVLRPEMQARDIAQQLEIEERLTAGEEINK